MKVTFLGTGTSQGVPVIACECHVCKSENPKDKRLRSSVLIESAGSTIVVDTGPDFRQQLLRENVKKLDGVVFTHGHKDHTAGLDDVRAFNYRQRQGMDIYADVHTQEIIMREFSYAFNGAEYPGIPVLHLHTIKPYVPFTIGDIELIPFEVLHFKLPVLGFRIGDFTYITDANHIPARSMDAVMGTQVLVLNALRREKHISHFTLNEAIALARTINPQQTYFTHLSHQMGLHQELSDELPPNFQPAYDGLSFEV